MLEYIPWVFTGISLTGAFLNAKGRLLEASCLWLFSNLFWLLTDFNAGLNAQAALYCAFTITSLMGIRTSLKQRKKDRGNYDEEYEC